MMRLLYPLIASSLITIVPFLVTFEKGQNIVRGLFGYSEFALLLLFAFVKTHFNLFESFQKGNAFRCSSQHHYCVFFKRIVPFALLISLFVLMLWVSWIDLQNLLFIKGWATGLYGILPFVTCIFAVVILWKTRGFSLPVVSLILFVSLVAHLAAYNFYSEQPLMQFPVVDYLSRHSSKTIDRKNLPEDFGERFVVGKQIHITDSASITKNFVDTLRSNVLVLVESWGIPIDFSRFANELSVFKGIPLQVGVHHRMYSRTRTAEREDLIAFCHRDSNGRRDSTFLPSEFVKRGYSSVFFYGGDSLEQWRYKYIRNVGFENVVWGEVLEDSLMAERIRDYLKGSQDSLEHSQRLFLAWTTRDTKFPLHGFVDTYSLAVDDVDSAYTERLMGSLKMVANLARMYPNVRFIVQGDHNPILSPRPFQERFYKRWVPYVVLN